MMRSFFHYVNTCPCCHEPHNNGYEIKKIGGSYYCEGCNTFFKNKVDLSDEKKYKLTYNTLLKIDEDFLKYYENIPLFWSVSTNIVEDSYLNWITTMPKGKYLVTWPLKTVKFIPLLLYYYLEKNRGNKIVVICDHDSFNEKTYPDIYNIINESFYIDLDEEAFDIGNNKEYNKLRDSDIIEKTIRIRCNVDRYGSQCSDIIDSYDSLTIFRRNIINDLNNIYEKDCIKSIEVIDQNKDKRNFKKYNDNGIFDLKFYVQEVYSGKMNFNTKWFWTALLNSNKITPLKNRIKVKKIDSNFNYNNLKDDINVFLISEEEEPKKIFDLIREIKPNLIIFTQFDDFFYDIIFNGPKSTNFMNYYNNADSNLLLFSNKPSLRYLYHYNKNFKENIILHTWDNSLVLNEVINNWAYESDYYNPLSFKRDEIQFQKNDINCKFIKVDEYDDLKNTCDMLLYDIKKGVDYNKIKKYFYDLGRTPLILRGDYRYPSVFKRYNYHYDYIMSIIRNEFDDIEYYEELKAKLDEKLQIKNSNNVILTYIKNIIEDLINENNSYISIIVHKYDVKGTKFLLKNDEKLSTKENYGVYYWSEFIENESVLSNTYDKHYVISLLPPSLHFSIFRSNVEQYYFVGEKNILSTYEKIIENRITEYMSFPLKKIDDYKQLPGLLYSILEGIDLNNEEIEEYVEQTITDFEIINYEEYIKSIYLSTSEIEDFDSGLMPGDIAWILIDPHGRCMIIPKKSSLWVKENGILMELNVEKQYKNKEDNIINKIVLIDKRGIYESYKKIFLRIMIIYGNNIKFSRVPYRWNSFELLYKDSIYWINILRKLRDLFKERYSLQKEDLDYNLALELSKQGLFAKDPNYIQGWWNNYEIVLTEKGQYLLYNVEHPRSLNDIIIIYEYIKNNDYNINTSIYELEKSYVASLTMQTERNQILKNQSQIGKFNPVYSGVYDELRKILDTSPTFTISVIKEVKIKKIIKPFIVFKNTASLMDYLDI